MFDHIYQSKGVDAAFSAACQTIREERAQLNALWESRFLQKRTLGDGRKKLWPVTAETISRTFDLADLDGSEDEAPEFFYVEDDGTLHPVTLGGQERNGASMEDAPTNTAFVFASAALVANGKVVGQVDYTDH